MVFWTLTMVYWTPYPWCIEPPTHGISNPLPTVFWTPYSWHIEPLTYGISNPLPMVYRIPLSMVYRTFAHLLIRNEGVQNTMGVQFTIQGWGVQFSIKGFNILCMKFDPGVNIPWGSIYHDTGFEPMIYHTGGEHINHYSTKYWYSLTIHNWSYPYLKNRQLKWFL